MKNFKKLLSVLCAVSLVLAMVTLPMCVSAAGTPLFSLNYEPTLTNLFSENFEGQTVSEFKFFDLSTTPITTTGTDNTNYVNIDTSNWEVGGYEFSEAMELSGGTQYKVAFDFKFKAEDSTYATVSLGTKSNAGKNPWDATYFRLLRWDSSGNLGAGAGDAAFEAFDQNGLVCTADNWYHYELTLNKPKTGKYTLEITKDGDAKKVSKEAWYNSDGKYDSLVFAGTVQVAMDNISVAKVENTIPEVVSFEEGTPPTVSLVSDNGNTYGSVNNVNWQNGGYAFSSPITTGAWEVSFKFNLQGAGGAETSIALAAASVKGNEYTQFRLLSYGIENNDDRSEITVNRQKKIGGELVPAINNWYDYKMIFDKDARIYTAEISNGADKALYSGSFTQEWDFAGLMFGADVNAFIDDIVVTATEPTTLAFVDNSGTPLETINEGTVVKAKLTGYNKGNSTAVVIIAEYIDGVLANAVCDTLTSADYKFAATTTKSITASGSGSVFKAFVWNSLSGLVPLTGNIIIPTPVG